jgi:hypothetical protein
MPDEEPIVSPAEPAIAGTPSEDTAVHPQRTAVYARSDEEEEWVEEPELPPRPRRRLLSPLPLALLGVLLAACGFVGGVLVEKGENSSSSSTASGAASSLASRFAALRGGGAGATGGSGAGGFAGAAGATAGSVAYISGDTLYVTTSEGNTVKVTTSAGTTVTKTVKGEVKAIHPGETVTVTGAKAASGEVTAESIRVGSSAGGGLGALFGGGGAAAGGKTGAGSTGGGEPALFGNGGG